MHKVVSRCIDQLVVGDPVKRETFTVFPLFNEGPAGPPYRLLADAVQTGAVTVTEKGAGTVPTIVLVNQSSTRVLVTQGEELIGGKQNRIVNVSLLVDAKTVVELPVSCVEAGRWHRVRHTFEPAEQAFPELRRAVTEQVAAHLRAARSSRAGQRAATEREAAALRSHSLRRADQGAVWGHVDEALASAAARTPTRDLHEAYRRRQRLLEDAETSVPYVTGAAGLVCAIAGEIVCAEFFDRPESCQRMWRRLVRSVAFEAAATASTSGTGRVSQEEVTAWLQSVQGAQVEAFPSVGVGQEVHVSGRDLVGSLLVHEGVVIHGALFSTSRAL